MALTDIPSGMVTSPGMLQYERRQGGREGGRERRKSARGKREKRKSYNTFVATQRRSHTSNNYIT